MEQNKAEIFREEINRKLNNVYTRIGKDDPIQLHAELDEIFLYKPVDNYFVYVKACLYLSEKAFEKVWSLLAGKDHWLFPGPYAPLLAQIQYECAIATNAPFEAKLHKILAYYCYLAATSMQNENRRVYAEEGFISDARECYENEIFRKNNLLDLFSVGSDQEGMIKNYADAMFEVSYNLMQDLQSAIILAFLAYNGMDNLWVHQQFCNMVKEREPNIGYLLQELSDKNQNLFILIHDEQSNASELHILAHLIRSMDRQVIVIESNVRENIIKLRNDHRLFNVIASRNMFHELSQVPELEHKIQCLSEFRGSMFFDELCFGYCGAYESYLSMMFQYDFKEGLTSEDRCLFSVVIPARNSAFTLQYTLQTVLNQRNIKDDEFEIIISDNSNKNNHDIKKLIEKLSNPRIKYCKTPIELPLHRSFEFAYGMARGKYIIPIGSDDGLVPWTLETLKIIIEKYPDENIIGWHRAFYQWSESNSNQRGKFIIPDIYHKGDYNDKVYSGLASLKSIMDKDGETLYSNPILYINTAFRRKFLSELLDSTGTIIDGYTQDVCMAVRSMLLNRNFVYLEYPLSVAGLSDGSLGVRMVSEVKRDEELVEKLSTETIRGMGTTIISMDYPFLVIPSTEGMFWSEIFKSLEITEFCKLLVNLFDDHDFKHTLVVLTGCRSRNDLDYFAILERIRWNAYQIDNEIGIWFDHYVYPAATEKMNKVIEGNTSEVSRASDTDYDTGYVNSKGLTLDARKFNVNNIAEAAELLSKIINL